jgi:cytoskeletal protein RodZ
MPSLGEDLKRQRELREITLREISDATKISVRILEAIENNNYKILPGGIFNRNFLRAYAQFIGLDAENVVRKYQQESSRIGEPEVPNLAHYSRNQANQSKKKNFWIYSAVLVLVVGAAALIWWLL